MPLAEPAADLLLLPCRCGGSGQITEYLDSDDRVTAAKVRCTKCRAETHGVTREAAVRRWREKNS
jgi:hypothetical protein